MSRRRWRTIGARALTVLGALLLVVSIAANFVERQALDTSEFEETARQLITDEAIQDQVASTLTEQLFTNVDVQAALEERLPPEQNGLAGPIAGALRPVAERLAGEILDRPRFQEAWVRALTASQAQVVRVLDDEAVFLETEGGVVALDLRPLLVELTNRLAVGDRLADQLPENAGVITIFEAEQLETAQDLTRLLRAVAAWIWVLGLAAWVGAVFLSVDRRREIRAIALAFVVVGLLVLAIRRVAGSYIVDELSTAAADEEAVRRTWEIITRLLADAGWAAIAVGLIALVGVWLFGSSRRGTAARRALAPYLAQPGLTYGVAAGVFLALFLWSPISYVQRVFVIAAFLVISVLGIEALRRKAARDFPDAEPGGLRLPALGGGRGGAAVGDELERLARLRADGVLTDEEFAAAKERVLAP